MNASYTLQLRCSPEVPLQTTWCCSQWLSAGICDLHVMWGGGPPDPRARGRTVAGESPSSPLVWLAGWLAGWLVTFALWHAVHSLHHSFMYAAKPGQTKRLLTDLVVTRVPAWERAWMCSNTALRWLPGISGILKWVS